jgi:hypothetical protein
MQAKRWTGARQRRRSNQQSRYQGSSRIDALATSKGDSRRSRIFESAGMRGPLHCPVAAGCNQPGGALFSDCVRLSHRLDVARYLQLILVSVVTCTPAVRRHHRIFNSVYLGLPRSSAGGREFKNRTRRSQHSLGVSPEHAVLPPGQMPRDMNDDHIRPLVRDFEAPMRNSPHEVIRCWGRETFQIKSTARRFCPEISYSLGIFRKSKSRFGHRKRTPNLSSL